MFLDLKKISIFCPKRVFLDVFLGHFWTSFVILQLGIKYVHYRAICGGVVVGTVYDPSPF